MEQKQELILRIRKAIDEYTSIVSFQLHNQRTTHMNEVRQHFRGRGRFYLGRNKLMQIALGRDAESEYRPGLAEMSATLVGTCGLFFTNEPLDKVIEYFNSFTKEDYPRAGFVATRSVTLPEGDLPCPPFEGSMDAYCRNTLIMPTEVRDGKLRLIHDLDVCVEGKRLTPEAARILRLLGDKMARFNIVPVCAATREPEGDGFVCATLDPSDIESDDEEEDKDDEEDEDKDA